MPLVYGILRSNGSRTSGTMIQASSFRLPNHIMNSLSLNTESIVSSPAADWQMAGIYL